MGKRKAHSKTLCFTILFLLFVFPLDSFSQTIQKIKEKSYCSLFSGADGDRGREFKTKVLMSYSTGVRVDGGDSFVYSDKCNGGDYFAVTSYSNSINWDKWENFFAKLPEGKNFTFEVKLSGILETSIIPQFGHLSWSRAQIEITQIDSIKDVTAFAEKPDSAAKTSLIDFGSSLSSINTEIMFFFLGSKNSVDIDEFIAADFVLTDSGGEKYNRKNYKELVNKGVFDEAEGDKTIGVSSGDVKPMQDSYKVYGFVTVSDKEGQEKRLNFENTFQRKTDSWSLIEIKLSNP